MSDSIESIRKSLKQEIECAFSGRPLPPPERIALERNEYPDYEGNAVGRFFTGKQWREITLESLTTQYGGDGSSCLAFLQPEALLYYLPAYLSMVLEIEDTDMVGDSVLFMLAKPGTAADPILVSRFAAFNNLTSMEKKAVRHVLEFLAEQEARRGDPNGDAEKALESHWRQIA